MNHDLGGDCISRTRAIERLKLNFPISQGVDNSRDRHRYMQALADIQAIREMPSVTPQEPTDKIFTKTDIDAIAKALNEGWELRANEVLDKLRAEIAELWHQYPMGHDYELAINRCLKVIDKYKAESEGNND